MSLSKLGALCAAALLTLSGTAVLARDANPGGTPFCSKSVTDNCMQREGHAVAAHRSAGHRTARHHEGKHRVASNHAKRHHKGTQHRKMAAKAVPAPARKM